MKTVKEVSKLTGVSIRTLRYYDAIGLLKPAALTGSGYRLYDDAALERLQDILLFRELQFPLKEIRQILDRPDFDRSKALEQQVTFLELKKEHLENLIRLARGTQQTGGTSQMDFSAFDNKKMEEYARQARESWGTTDAYQEFEKKHGSRSPEENRAVGQDLMDLFREFGTMRELAPEDPRVQAQVDKLRTFITENYYTCTPEILLSLGSMYSGGGSMTENIDQAGGTGTGEFTHRAIQVYCHSTL